MALCIVHYSTCAYMHRMKREHDSTFGPICYRTAQGCHDKKHSATTYFINQCGSYVLYNYRAPSKPSNTQINTNAYNSTVMHLIIIIELKRHVFQQITYKLTNSATQYRLIHAQH